MSDPRPVAPAPLAPSDFWQLKPWWCQPWSIVLTGFALPAIVWLLGHRWWLVAPVVLGVLGWWGLFLYWVPRQYADLARRSPEAPER